MSVALLSCACATTPHVAEPTAQPSAPVHEEHSVGEARIVEVKGTGRTDVVLEFAHPTESVLGVAYGTFHPVLDVLVDGRAIDLGDAVGCYFRPDRSVDDRAPFRVTVEFSKPLPPDAREIALRGTISLLVGLDPESHVVKCGADPTGLEFVAGELRCAIRRVEAENDGRVVWISADGGGEESVRKLEFLDAHDRTIPSDDLGMTGGNFGGNVVFGSWRFRLHGDAEITALRVSSWGRDVAWNVSIDVKGPVAR